MNLTQFTVIGLAITACITATKVHAKAGVNAEKDTPFVCLLYTSDAADE